MKKCLLILFALITSAICQEVIHIQTSSGFQNTPLDDIARITFYIGNIEWFNGCKINADNQPASAYNFTDELHETAGCGSKIQDPVPGFNQMEAFLDFFQFIGAARTVALFFGFLEKSVLRLIWFGHKLFLTDLLVMLVFIVFQYYYNGFLFGIPSFLG